VVAADHDQDRPWQQEQRQGNEAITSRGMTRGGY
jgi:hypothetical protein